MNDEAKIVTRRQMLKRLGLAATAIYAAPVLLQLSEARASSFSGPDSSGPRGRRRRHAGSNSGPSFSNGGKRSHIYGADQGPRRSRIRVASSFSR